MSRHLVPTRPCFVTTQRRQSETSDPRRGAPSAARRLGRSVTVLQSPDEEAVMALARVVVFEGVSSERMSEMKREMEGSDRPDDVPGKEIVVLHDPDAEKSVVVIFFDTEDDYRRGDEALNAMPAGDTPGRRTSVTKYD